MLESLTVEQHVYKKADKLNQAEKQNWTMTWQGEHLETTGFYINSGSS